MRDDIPTSKELRDQEVAYVKTLSHANTVLRIQLNEAQREGRVFMWLAFIFAFICIFLGVHTLNAQSNTPPDLSLSIHQDGKLLFMGDDHGNDPGTIDLVLRLKMFGRQFEHGYLVIYPEVEYAELSSGKYVRYSANVGYTFNKLIVDNTEYMISAGYGILNREGAAFRSYSINNELLYRVNKRMKLSLLFQLCTRPELKLKYDSSLVKPSLYGGLEFRIL